MNWTDKVCLFIQNLIKMDALCSVDVLFSSLIAAMCDKILTSGDPKFQILTEEQLKEVLSVLMLCAPDNHRRPFSYHTKIADFEYFHVLSVFSWNKLT